MLSRRVIEDQRNFKELTGIQLKHYPNVEKLTIMNSGLERIASGAFNYTRKLKEV